MASPTTITVHGPRYWSQMDESLFFFWLQAIPSVRHIDGSGADLIITLTTKHVSKRDLREFRAIFNRYKLDLKVLSIIPGTRERWYRDPEGYWNEVVLGRKPKRRTRSNAGARKKAR